MPIKLRALLLILGIFAVAVPAGAETGGENITLAVFDFAVSGGLPNSLRETFSDRLKEELFKKGFVLLDRNNIENMFAQKKLNMSDCTSDVCLIQTGNNLSTRIVINGIISKDTTGKCAISYGITDTELKKTEISTISPQTCDEFGILDISAKLAKAIHRWNLSFNEMVFIPAGEFMMGCNSAVDNQCEDNEKPYHKVYLDAYYIDKHEVTVDEFGKCVEDRKCGKPQTGDNCNYYERDRGNHPINCVNWNDADSYCSWAGKRLPTEAEWEKAARGTDGRKYPWGDSPRPSCERAVVNYYKYACGRKSTWPVCSKTNGNSQYGLCDMIGNVWEWVADWYDANYNMINSSTNPKGPSSGSVRLLRGGSWYNNYPKNFRVSYRLRADPIPINNDIGFRCAH
jgi:sulfatase modifying factor 1